MVNQKARGTRAEVQVMDELGAWGYDVVRSAASKGAADLVAVHDDEILFVQVKLGKDEEGARFVMPSPAERRELIRISRRCKGYPVAVTRFPGRGSIAPRSVYRLLVGEAPDAWLMWTCRSSVDDRWVSQAAATYRETAAHNDESEDDT